MKNNSAAYGIFQGDIIIRTAVKAAIDDLRANPWALDYVFSSLAADELTISTYGQKEIDRAKQWFLNNDIPVVNNLRVDNLRLPCVSISMQESSEQDNTLADKNYDVEEIFNEYSPVLYGPFAAMSYDSETGRLMMPVEVLNTTIPAEGMIIEDASGCSSSITEAHGEEVYVAPNLLLKTGKLWLKSRFKQKVQLEAANFKESYVIGCHSRGEPFECLYLHSIILFCMMRYRQKLLEERGFVRSSVSSTDVRVNESFDTEIVYSRFITLNGYVRQFWPKQITNPIENVIFPQDGQTNGEYLQSDGWGWGKTDKGGIGINADTIEGEGKVVVIPSAYVGFKQ
jgi:hypothetical protein